MHEDSHGHSVAAWVGVTIMLVGSVVAVWGVVLSPDWLLYVGLALGVVGALRGTSWTVPGWASRSTTPPTADRTPSWSPHPAARSTLGECLPC
ncbi:hypothetical protein BJF80_14670 [Serinicoccus sp. CUA-874]|uniref:HGxxPAAW family protein n=1 Tax=Serinicoccus sp. CUA-874 TaxID=1517939 RepID=UPI00096284CB|nr:HGxxPAAW family protein [Serinicoccus sp. CUA-874]OLT18520.1 hypothetical protein BJF80_14670 [Serinicoccus sp. CUA-874]